MHRFFIPRSQIIENLLLLKGSEWHHCRTVLRAKKGDLITLFDGEGTEYITEINEMDRRAAKLKLLQKNFSNRLPYSIHLAQALPKSKPMDFIVQKATELGVCEIIPMLSERSVVKLRKDEANSKLSRWQDIAIEAAKQCGLNWLPQISHPQTVKEVVTNCSKYHLALIGSLQAHAKPLWSYLSEINQRIRNAIIMIGPEGDFAPAEIEMACSAGFRPLNLGPTVLRCDTAAIYSISTLIYELSRLK